MEKDSEIKEYIVHKVSGEYIRRYFDNLNHTVGMQNELYSTRFLHLGDVVVRVLVYDRNLDVHLSHELAFIIDTEVQDRYDYSIIIWLTPSCKPIRREHRLVEECKPSTGEPVVTIDDFTGRVIGHDESKKCFYYGFPDSNPEKLASEGHIFFRQFYRMLKDSKDSSLVHGACVGVGENGVLLCAKGNRGKSTLSVLSLLKGFNFVSDDYMVIEKRDGRLYADPIYSVMTLSPSMYNEMFEELEGTRFISNNWDKSKYIFSVANLHSRFRSHYPVKVCMLPEIVSDPEPSISLCDSSDKGRAITSMVHSTISQMGDYSDTVNTLKIMGLLKDQKFYKIRLCRNLHKNVECLRRFLADLE